MRRGRLVFAVALVAAAPVAVAWAQDASEESAIGGGEFVLTVDQVPHPGEGPGDTIAFTAQSVVGDDTDAAEGEVVEVDRIGPTAGRTKSIFHSEVFCLRVDGNEAVIAFRPKQADAPPTLYHQMLVIDLGEGMGDDLIFVDRQSETPPCESVVPDLGQSGTLARGDVQVDDAP
jgi:hypothetical protein